MPGKIKELDIVALLCDQPGTGLIQGQVGTVVETLKDSVYEVEFCGDDGKPYVMLSLNEDDLIVLHYSKNEAA